MEMLIFEKADTLAFFLEGEIDHHFAAILRPQIDEQLNARRPARLWLDFSGVSFMDSSAIGLIMGRYRLGAAWNCSMSITGLSDRNKKVMKLAGISKIAEITEKYRMEEKINGNDSSGTQSDITGGDGKLGQTDTAV